MKLTVFNGSPRGRWGNTDILLKAFLRGFEVSGDNTYELFHLNRIKGTEKFKQAFTDAEQVLLAFPLYADSMPAMVKAFIEALEPFCGRKGNPAIGFIVQSGLPEAVHSRCLEVYLEKLASRLGGQYLGTVIKGGCEGLRISPVNIARKILYSFFLLGKAFGETGEFDERLVRKMARPERMSRIGVFFVKLMCRTGLMTSGPNSALKAHGAYEKRFARPYAE